MNKEVVKKAFESAEQELENKLIEKIKDIVKKTLEHIKILDEKIDTLQEERKILKLDLDDLKEGRLDRIEQRQKEDAKAKKTSVVEVIREVHHHHYDWWYQPYKLIYHEKTYPKLPDVFYCNGNSAGLDPVYVKGQAISFGSTGAQDSVTTNNAEDATFTVNSSLAKKNVIGTYNVFGTSVHLR